GTPSASCRCPSARGSAWTRRARLPASPAPAAASAPQTTRGTSRPPPDGTARARPDASPRFLFCILSPEFCILGFMGDSGEGLVDAEARIQERMEEREADRRRTSGQAPKIDPEKVREVESLKLARAELTRQAELTTAAVRKQQIAAAIAEIDKRL